MLTDGDCVKIPCDDAECSTKHDRAYWLEEEEDDDDENRWPAVEVTTLNGSRRKIARAQLELRRLSGENVECLRKLNASALPVHYDRQFYYRLLADETKAAGEMAKSWTRMAFFGGRLIGAICCRIERGDGEETADRGTVNILTLACLPQFRRRGIATILFEDLFDFCRIIKKSAEPVITSIGVNVQVINGDAINFYKKFNFSIVETIPDYYRRIESCAAYRMQLTL